MIPLSSQFTSNTLITRFNELRFFTSVSIAYGSYLFRSCTNLEQLNTSSIVRFGDYTHYAFAYCPKLDRLVFKSLTNKMAGGQMFRGSGTRYVILDVNFVAISGSSNFTYTWFPIYVQDDLVEGYKTLDSSSKFLPLSQFSTDFPGETY